MIELRLMNTSGVADGFAPDWEKLDFTDLYSSEGTVQVEYAKAGLNYSRLIAPNCEGALFLNNAEIDGSRFRTSQMSNDEAKPEKNAIIQAITWVSRLKEIRVYPPNWPTAVPKENVFLTATAGQIMRTLLLAGQARGVNAATQTTFTFTNTLDSAGNGWTRQATLSIMPGMNLFDVLKNLVNLGMCDFVTKERQLYMVNPGALGVDRTVQANPVILRRGRDFSDAPSTASARELLTTVLVEGDGGLFQEVNDAAAVTAWGRREGFLSQSSIPDPGTLTVAGQAYIDIYDHLREERTHELTFSSDGPLPFLDYKAADWIFTDVAGINNKYKVLQVRLSWDAAGRLTGGVTLNDRFDDLDVKNQQRLDGFNGVMVTKTPIDQIDTTIPAAPAGLSLSSSWYADGTGEGWATISASWAAVTQNTDGTLISDLSHYEVGWKLSTAGNDTIYTATNAATSWSPITPGLLYNVRVRAVDRSGNVSAWSAYSNITGASDTTPPAQPSAPVVDNYLGVLRIDWDGKDSIGGAMPIDFKHTEVHLSTVNNFTPDATTLVDALVTGGRSVIADLTYGTTYYAKLIAVDKSGNKSTASAQGSGSPKQVVETDIAGNVIGLDHIQFKDATNLIGDGSFELAERRAELLTHVGTGSWSFVNTGAAHGLWAVSVSGTVSAGLNRQMYLMPADQFSQAETPSTPGKQYYWRFMYRGVSANGVVALVYRSKSQTGVYSWQSITGNVSDGTWRVVDGQFTAPADAMTHTVYLEVQSSVTAGTWFFDRVELRDVVDSLLIKDLAVTTAKIANLAVNDAKIGSVSAGKITVGTLIADVTVGARIKTADSGARVELNSAGLQAYNSGGTQTVSVAAASGNVSIIGEFKTANSGQRMIFNPSGSGNPKIEFWPTGAPNPSVMSVGSGGAGNYLTIESDWSGFYRTMLSVQQDFIAMRVLNHFSDPNANGGGFIDCHKDSTYMGFRKFVYGQDNYMSFTSGGTKFFGSIYQSFSAADAVMNLGFGLGPASGFSTTYGPTLVYTPKVWGNLFSPTTVAHVIDTISSSSFGVDYSANINTNHTYYALVVQ